MDERRVSRYGYGMSALVALLLLLPQQQPASAAPGGGPQVSTESPVLVTLSGEADLDFLYRNPALNETSHWVPGGLSASSPQRESDNRVVGLLAVELDIQVDAHWSARLRLSNQRIQPDTAAVPDQTNSLGEAPESTRVYFERAWVEGVDLFVPGLSLRVGAMDYRADPAGAAPIFLDAGRAESPWAELPDSTAPPFPSAGTNTVPQTRRDELQPTGAVLEYRTDLLLASAFALPAVIEGTRVDNDEALYGLRLRVPFDEEQSRLEAIGAVLVGGTDIDGSGSREQRVFTFGGGGLWQVFDLPVEIGAEGYLQFGDAGYVAGQKLTAKGFAGRVRARLSLETFWLEAGYLLLSGDENGLDDEEGRFLNYENNDEFLIVESNEFGLDLDNNLRSWRAAAGAVVTDDFLGSRLEAEIRVGGFRFDHAVPLSPDPWPGSVPRRTDMGTEIDAVLRIPLTPSLTLQGTFAVLTGAEAMESFTLAGDDTAVAGCASLRLRF